jgi:phage FluMu protein Com
MPILRKLTKEESQVIPGPNQVVESTRISLCGRLFKRAIGRIGHERYCPKCQELQKLSNTNGMHAETWVDAVQPIDIPSVVEVVETITPLERRAHLHCKLMELDEARMHVHNLETEIAKIVQQLCADLDTALEDAEKYRQIQAILGG